MNYKLYKIAAMKKYRFETPHGVLSVEDLFDLPITSSTGGLSLDTIAVGIAKELRDMEVVSFVDEVASSPKRKELENKLELLKDVIATKKRKLELEKRRQQKQRLLAKLEKLEEENLTADDIREKLKELEEEEKELAEVAA